MKIDIVRYSTKYFDRCMVLFESNHVPYFAADESALYRIYLTDKAIDQAYYLALDDDQLLAAGGYTERDGVLWLVWGMVGREWHGRGIGRRLLEYRLLEMQRRYPGALIRLNTSQHTAGFYEKYGFVQEKRVKDGFEAGLDEVVMRYQPD